MSIIRWIFELSLLNYQSKLLANVKDKALILAGDGRCDSPGKSVKFCTYSMMDIDSGVILHAETVDKREVGLKSPNMEKEAFTRSLEFLLPRIKCTEIITDASTSIRSELGLFKVCSLYTVNLPCSF